jgi:DNA-binding NarL/FixJ family response regulator
VTVSVICFPDGRLPSPRWRWVVVGVVVVTGLTATMSAVWPVEYAATGVNATHPLGSSVPGAVDALWSALAHPSYVVLQTIWIVALADRWRMSDAGVRRQLGWLVAAAALSVAALLLGLAVAGSPVAGLLSATLLPVAAGWAIVHGQQRATHAALTWASGTGSEPDDLPDDLARAVATALSAPAAVLWMGPAHDLHPIGVWPSATDSEPSTLAALEAAAGSVCRPVVRQAEVVGALSVRRDVRERLSVAESRLLDGLTGQAALVIDRVGLAVLVERQRRAGHLDNLTPRERDVLELMARGLTNAAICDQLHLSVKTVEPVVGAIFAKLGLHLDAASNRRVLAALAYHQRR